MFLLKRFFFLIDIIYEKIVITFASLAFLFIIFGIFVEVISRYLFGISRGMIAENVVILYLICAFLVAGLVTKREEQIGVSLCSNIIEKGPYGKNIKKIFTIIIYLGEILFSLVLIYSGIINFFIKYRSRTTSIFSYVIPSWMYHLSLPIGMFFVLMYCLRDVVKLFSEQGDI